MGEQRSWRPPRPRHPLAAHVHDTKSSTSKTLNCGAEELAAAAPASPALAAAVVEAAAARGGDKCWAAWALPLAAGLLAAAVPTPAPHIWLRVPPPACSVFLFGVFYVGVTA